MTANSHDHVEVVTAHERRVNHRQATHGAHSVRIGVDGKSDLCAYRRGASSAPRNSALVFLVKRITHCTLNSTALWRYVTYLPPHPITMIQDIGATQYDFVRCNGLPETHGFAIPAR